MFIDFRQRGSEKERQTSICCPPMHSLVASYMCPAQRWNPQSWRIRATAPTNGATLPRLRVSSHAASLRSPAGLAPSCFLPHVLLVPHAEILPSLYQVSIPSGASWSHPLNTLCALEYSPQDQLRKANCWSRDSKCLAIYMAFTFDQSTNTT